MGNSVRCCMIFLFLSGAAHLAFGQGVGLQRGVLEAGFQVPSSLTSLTSIVPSNLQTGISVGYFRFEPRVRVGYQRMGLSFNLPTFAHEDNSPAPLDLSLRDANAWVGSAGFDVYVSSGLLLFGAAEANAERNVTLITFDQPLNYQSVASFKPFEWTGSRFQWWSVEGGVGYMVGPGATLAVGLRYDGLTLDPRDPRDASGNPVNYGAALPGGGSISERAYGDVKITDWIPYLGLLVKGRSYRTSILWSPLVSTQVQMPVRFVRDLLLSSGQTFHTDHVFAFRLRKPGSFLEGDFEYRMPVGETVALGFWCRGSWLRVTGTGEMDADFSVLRVGGGTSTLFTLHAADDQTATFSRHMLAGGLSAQIPF